MQRASFAAPKGLDRAGVLLSGACAVHCALMPIVAGLLPLIGLAFLASETAEAVLLLAAAVLATASLAGGCRHHRRFLPLGLMTAGFAMILTGRLILDEGGMLERVCVVAGALTIAGAHLVNWRTCCEMSRVTSCGPA